MAAIDSVSAQLDALVNKVKQAHPQGLVVSDLIDNEGRQYIDIVMEGGGMLGIALLGYITVLERLGIRFLGVGGTSAGSITALLLAATKGDVNGMKSGILLEELINKNFYDFVDGDDDARDFIDTWQTSDKKWKLALKAVQIIDNIQNNLGLNPGNTFVAWITKLLAANGIHSLKELKAHLATGIPGLHHRHGNPLHSGNELRKLALITADVTTETKVELPRMAELYWKDTDKVNPALFARASMSVPYFFEPFVVPDIPKKDVLVEKWQKWTAYSPQSAHEIPSSITFIDGGIVSNFPINIFHQPKSIPQAPTFGVKLGLDKVVHDTSSPLKLLSAIFNSARHTLDYDFITNNPDYKHLVAYIDIDETTYGWLDFNMSLEKKLQLFMLGAETAANFLIKFDWENYKGIRGGIATANILAPDALPKELPH